MRFGWLGLDGVYRWNDFGGTLEDLDKASEVLKKWYLKRRLK